MFFFAIVIVKITKLPHHGDLSEDTNHNRFNNHSSLMAGISKSGYFCQKCKKDNEDIMIHCFSCDANYHSGCIGIKGRMLDKLNFDDGFHYYCPDHRKLSVSALLSKISSLKKLNVQLIQLIGHYKDALDFDPDMLLQELEIKKQTNRSEVDKFNASKSIEVPTKRTLRDSTVKASQKVAGYVAKPVPTKTKRLNEGNNVQTNKETESSNATCPQLLVHSPSIQSISLPSTSSDCIGTSSSPTKSYADAVHDVVDEQLVRIADDESVTETSNRNKLRAAKEPLRRLMAAPPVKKIVLTGLQLGTSAEDVKNHIQSECGKNTVVHVTKMRLGERSEHSSFVILPGRNTSLFNTLICSDFWPENTTVSEFDENFRMNRTNNRKKKQHHQTHHRKQD